MSSNILPQKNNNVNIKSYKIHRLECERLADVYHELFLSADLASDMDRWEQKESRVRGCGTWLMGDLYERAGEHKYVLTGANFCRTMLCPMCQWRRALKLYSTMLRIWTFVFDDYRTIEFDESKHRVLPQLRALLLTLTVPNVSGENLRDTIASMSDGWSRLRKLADFDAIKGYYRCLEVTYNASNNTYHPHYHVLLLVTDDYFSKDKQDYIHHNEWLDLWRQSMRDERIAQVDIRALRGSTPQAMLKNLNECCKYTCKPSDFLSGSLELQCRVTETIDKALDKVRRASFGGWLKDAKMALKLDDELIESDSKPNSEWRLSVPNVWYHWSSGVGDYIAD